MIEWDSKGNIIPESYGIPVSVCPIQGHATSNDWRGACKESLTWPGRNHPKVGKWVIDSFSQSGDVGWDVMCGIGGLWIASDLKNFSKLYLSDWSFQAFNLISKNFTNPKVESFVMDISKSRLDTFEGEKATFVMFSPPFRQNKSAGRGDRQRNIVQKKNISIVESFKGGQLTDKPAFFEMMRMAYQNIYFSTTDDARMYIILRNYIRKNKEVDEIGEHLNALKIADWKVKQMFVRDLVRPTAFQAWKLKKDPNMCWTTNEYILECVKC